jgi:hypothetical protein
VKVGSHQQEQLKLRPKLNFLNALKGSDVDDNEGSKTLGISSVEMCLVLNMVVPKKFRIPEFIKYSGT